MLPGRVPGVRVDPAEVRALWEGDLLPVLSEYVRVPCLSPAFDPDWEARGELLRTAGTLRDWCRSRPVPGLHAEVVARPGLTPVLLVEIPAAGGASGTVLVYGHLDKQPPLGDWLPYEPVRRGDRLYGRGAADDGYSVFAAVGAMELLSRHGTPHPRVVVLIEASEESGSPDLDAHLDELAGRLGELRLVVCLDSGALDYERLWVTESLRGNVVATVRVDVLGQGVHSGLAGGVVPSSFRVLRQLLDRIEDARTGEVLLPGVQVALPAPPTVPVGWETDYPVVPGLRLSGATPGEQLVRRAWSPALAVTGMAGIPSPGEAGNVLRPYTAAKISLRLPPTVRARETADSLVAVLTADPPQGARVRVEVETPSDGWLAPPAEAWVTAALDEASTAAFGAPAATYGEGGTIPFLASLGARFPGLPLVALGVLGPGSNAHGPHEFLHVPMARAVTVATGHLVAAAGGRR